MRDTESTTAATPVGHDAVPSEPTRDTFAARLRRRYHAGIARCIAQNVVKPGATVLLVDPRHDTYITALDSRAVAVVANAPEARTRLGAAFPEVRVLGGSLADAAAAGPFDYIVFPDLLSRSTALWDQLHFAARTLCTPATRLLMVHWNFMWEPLVKLADWLKLRGNEAPQNWISPPDIDKLLARSGLELIRLDRFNLLPFSMGLIGSAINRFLGPLPLLQHLCFNHITIARPAPRREDARDYTVTVVIPTRNERENVELCVTETPDFGAHTELLFIDGASTDGTVEAIEAQIEKYKGQRDIRLIHQVEPGEISEQERHSGKMLKKGKGHAVRKAFAAAKGEVLMILDSDRTVPPAMLPEFYRALIDGHGEFINGNRLVYPQEKEAMRFLNTLANRFFGRLFSYLIGQEIKDTLCGTKVLFKQDYAAICANRAYFGDFDPFGDFDLLFGASRLNLKITEVFVRYRERSYGDIKIERFKHGLLLLKMSWIAFKRLKLRMQPHPT